MFSDFEWARWMGRNGRVAAETAFNWDAIADQTLSVYRS
jgi:glycosyltransferase involved in cell wall biosynthesis